MGHREQLLAAARRLLERRGYAHITARDLVAESDTNLASIGYHFGSKAALLNAAIESALEEWTDQFAALVMADPTATPVQRGMATWVAVLESLPARRPILQSYIEALAQAQREPELRTQLAEHYRRDHGGRSALPGDRHLRRRRVRRPVDAVAARSRAVTRRRGVDGGTGDGLGSVVPGSLSTLAQRRPLPPETSRTAGRTSAR